MKNKKGASAILAYVLLISLTVILAVSVTIYMKNKAKTQAEELTETVGTVLDCESVGINAYLEVDNVVVTNVGAKTIYLDLRYQRNNVNDHIDGCEENGLFFKCSYDSDAHKIRPKSVNSVLPDEYTKIIDVSKRQGKVDVIPKVVINKKKIGCIDKKVTVG